MEQVNSSYAVLNFREYEILYEQKTVKRRRPTTISSETGACFKAHDITEGDVVDKVDSAVSSILRKGGNAANGRLMK